MPITNGTYTAPTWANNGAPPLNATELQATTDTTAQIPTHVRPNLLDNWYFVGGGSQQGGGQLPINQRGSATYSPSAGQYTIDRWYLRIYNGATVLSCDADELTITSGGAGFQGIMQSIENGKALLAGKTVTLSALITHNDFEDNTYLSLTNGSSSAVAGTYLLMEPLVGVGLISATVTVPTSLSNNYVNFVISCNGTEGKKLSIVAVKLELGDTQTLAHWDGNAWVLNELPNYQEQLFRCQTSTADSADTYANKPNLVGFQVNPNLLDNWYFVGGGSQQGGYQFPINQRGNTSYSNVSGYTIDRWAIQTTRSLTLGSDGITITPTSTNNGRVVVQGLRGIPLLGKTITVSMLCTSSGINNVYVGIFANTSYTAAYDTYIPANKNSRIVDGNGVYLLSATANMPNDLITSSRDKLTFGFGFTNTGTIVPSFTVIAAKLEYGSTQTLAHQENGVWVLNEIPNFQEQLYRCKTSTVDSGDTYANKTNAYTDIAAPTNHASSATTYGVGTSSNYGHLKLSDSTSSTSSTNGGIAATPAAIKTAYDLATTKTANTGTITAIQANGTSVATSGTANIPAATTSAYGVTQLNTSTTSTSTTTATTPSAVKTVNDRITYGSSDLTAGTSSLTTGVFYAYYT